MHTEQALEAVLFFKGEALTVKELASLTKFPEAKVREGLAALESSLSSRGVRLVQHEDTFSLRTAVETAPLIEAIQKEELSRDLGKAGLEVLAIILYKGPSSRAVIDHTRGVNSSSTLRNLLIRGLIERVPNPDDDRSFLYKPSLDLLAHLGVESLERLPKYAEMRSEIDAFLAKPAEPADADELSQHHGTES